MLNLLFKTLLISGILGLQLQGSQEVSSHTNPTKDMLPYNKKIDSSDNIKAFDTEKVLVHLLCGKFSRHAVPVTFCLTEKATIMTQIAIPMVMRLICCAYGYADECDRQASGDRQDSEETCKKKPLARGWLRPVGQMMIENIMLGFWLSLSLAPTVLQWFSIIGSQEFQTMIKSVSNEKKGRKALTVLQKTITSHLSYLLAINAVPRLLLTGSQMFSDKHEDWCVSFGRQFASK